MTTKPKHFGAVTAVLMTVSIAASAMLLASTDADASACARIAGKLASQNQEVQRILGRDPNCMRKHASHTYALQTKPKSAWKALCETGTTAQYTQLASNRDKILRTCIPRGSHD